MPLGERPRQLDLTVGFDAGPVVDDDIAGAREGGFVDLVAGTHDIRIGNGDDHLPGLQPFAVEHRHLGVGGAGDNMGAAHDLARIVDRDGLEFFAGHLLSERGAVRRVRTEHLDALDRTHRAYGPTVWHRLHAGAEQAEHARVLARRERHRQRRGGADPQPGEIGLVHEGERLAGAQVVEDDDGVVDVVDDVDLAAVPRLHRREGRAGAHAGDTRALDRAGLDVGGVAPRRIGRGGAIAQPRRIDGALFGQIAGRRHASPRPLRGSRGAARHPRR